VRDNIARSLAESRTVFADLLMAPGDGARAVVVGVSLRPCY